MTSTHTAAASSRFEIRFESLLDKGQGFAFPCNERGLVDIDALNERARGNYFFARAMLGREYALPRVVPAATAGVFRR